MPPISADEQLARELQQQENQAAAGAAQQQGRRPLCFDLTWLLLMVCEAGLVMTVDLNPLVKLLFMLGLPFSVFFIPHYDHASYRGLRALWQQISARGLTSNQCLKWLAAYLVVSNVLLVITTAVVLKRQSSMQINIACLSFINIVWATKLLREDHALSQSQDYDVLTMQSEVEHRSSAGSTPENAGVELQAMGVANNEGKDVWDDL